MISPISIATDGYLENYPLSMATSGYIVVEALVAVEDSWGGRRYVRRIKRTINGPLPKDPEVLAAMILEDDEELIAILSVAAGVLF